MMNNTQNAERMTPRVDAVVKRREIENPGGRSSIKEYYVSADFARQLERELAEALEERDSAIIKYTRQVDASEQAHKRTIAKVESLRVQLATAERERDEARADCVVKDGALKGMLASFNDGHVPTLYRGKPGLFDAATMSIANAKAALATNPGASLLERLEKAEAQRNAYEGKCVEAIQERNAAQERVRSLEGALKRLSKPLDCGCDPCRGQCRTEEVLLEEINQRRDYAEQALSSKGEGEKRVEPLPGPSMCRDCGQYEYACECVNGMGTKCKPQPNPQTVPTSDPSTWFPLPKATIDLKTGELVEEENPQTVPRSVADGLAQKAKEAYENDDPSEYFKALAAYRAAQAIDGRVE